MRETIRKLTEELKAFNNLEENQTSPYRMMFGLFEQNLREVLRYAPMSDEDKDIAIAYEVEFKKLLALLDGDAEKIANCPFGAEYPSYEEMVATQKETLQHLEDLFLAKMYVTDFNPVKINRYTVLLRPELVVSGYKFIDQCIEAKLRDCF